MNKVMIVKDVGGTFYVLSVTHLEEIKRMFYGLQN